MVIKSQVLSKYHLFHKAQRSERKSLCWDFFLGQRGFACGCYC